jgi:hypothetical protein
MGRQTNIKIVGTHGGTIYYKMYDDFFMRSRPKKNKQTSKTKQAAACFGLAQGAAGIMRSAFAGLMERYTIFDNKNNLAQPINEWILGDGLNADFEINNIPGLTGYEFNSCSLLSERLKISLAVARTADGSLQLTIPAFNPVEKIAAPADTIQVTLHIAAAGCNVKGKQLTGMYSTKLIFDYRNKLIPAKQLSLPVSTEAGNLTVIYATTRYSISKRNQKKIIAEKAWLPGAIISAMYN